MLENKHLRSFLRVLDLGGFSRASRSLNIAQPAISQHVKKLEEHLGVTLLERSAHGVSPTHAGREFAKRARQILELIEGVEQQFKVGPKVVAGEVTLGLPGSVCPVLAQPLIVEASRQYPHIKLIVTELMSGDLADMLRDGRMDLAVLFNISETDDFTSEPLAAEALHLVGPPDDPLLSGDTLPASRLVGLPLVGTRPPHGLRLQIDRWANENGIDLNFTLEADAPSVLVSMAAAGINYSLLSHSAIRAEIAAGRMSSAEVTDPGIQRTACLCGSKRVPSFPAREAIAELTRKVANEALAQETWLATSV